MALYNLVRAYTSTNGTGSIVVGSAVPGFLNFADASVADGATVSYGIRSGNNSEVGRGTYTLATNTLSRDTVLKSTNGGNKINLTGTSELFVTILAEDVTTGSTDHAALSHLAYADSGHTGFEASGAGAAAVVAHVGLADPHTQYQLESGYTAADVLSKLLTVDGTGSGLDADLLDGQHGSYYATASTTPIMYTDTKANILAANKTAGQFAYATDTDEVYVSLGSTTWMVSPFKLLTANPDPDIGLYEWNNRLGYGVDYITNKLLANVHFGANASTTEGGTWVDKSAEPYTFKIYLNGEARTIMVDFSIALGHLVHYPFDADQAVEVWTGNSVEIGLNGLPVIQEYETDIGAFPAMRILNGGTF